MFPIRRILVPVDFSAGSRAASERAVEFAEAFGASGTLLHVWSLPQPIRPDLMVSWENSAETSMLDVIRGQATRDIESVLASVPERARQRFTVRVEEGDVVTTILSVAAQESADLIVVGTHGRTGLGHFLLGSVAEKLLRRAPCPVLTVRVPA